MASTVSSGANRRADLRASPSPNYSDLAHLVQVGRAIELPQHIDQLHAQIAASCSAELQEELLSQALLAALRACVSKRCFNEGLAAYDHVASRLDAGQASLWSVLLYIAVEARKFELGVGFFQKLSMQTSPSGHDFVNMVRCYIHQRDLKGLQSMLSDLDARGCAVDAFARNKALAACSCADTSSLQFAELVANGAALDVIGYNTLMKLYAKAGQLPRILELRSEMLSRDIDASEVTFGILLDACMSVGDLDRAKNIFEDLCGSGLRLNVVHCTTFIKGLIAAGKLGEADDVLSEMLRMPNVKPDLITYSTLVKAHADQGNVTAALAILERMIQQGVSPDEIMFNGVLNSCCAGPSEPVVTLRTFEVLVTRGLEPSTMTLSILLKALLLSRAWELALGTLDKLTCRFAMEAEVRLYVQIAQAGLKAGNGAVAVKAYNVMLQAIDQGRVTGTFDPSITFKLLRQCASSGHHSTAVQIREAARTAGISVDYQPMNVQKPAARWR